MIVAKDTFLIQVDRAKNSTLGIKGINGKDIVIDTDYNKYKHSTQIGRIFATPIRITSKYQYDLPLNINDVVVFHHFVCQPDHKTNFGEGVYRCEYFHIYAKLEGWVKGVGTEAKDGYDIMPIEDVIFVEPILEDESNMYSGVIQTKPHREYLKQQGIVFAASKKARSKGILSGDKVFYTKDADYQIKVVDANLYRMRLRNIVAIERDGKLACLADRIIVKEIKEENKAGILDSPVENSQRKGTVVAVGTELRNAVIAGQVIYYYNGVNGSFTYNGEPYAFIELRNINYIKN